MVEGHSLIMDSIRVYFPNTVTKNKFKHDLTNQSRKCEMNAWWNGENITPACCEADL